MSQLPESIKIDDVASGRIEASVIYEELERLKLEINMLRNEISTFVKALVTISDDMSQQSYYDSIEQRIFSVREAISKYCVRYNRLIPVINLTQIKLGQNVEILSAKATSPSKK